MFRQIKRTTMFLLESLRQLLQSLDFLLAPLSGTPATSIPVAKRLGGIAVKAAVKAVRRLQHWLRSASSVLLSFVLRDGEWGIQAHHKTIALH
mmetsp:Transcript_39723/g.95957  ORF Transcript_39723/g.95957 Transcript_39723/m.95957 type:complete len:93 (+) Transcript_39723:1265-1543(+)